MKTLDKDTFRNDSKSRLGEIIPKSYDMFEKTFFDVLDHHTPEKRNLFNPITNDMLQKRCK